MVRDLNNRASGTYTAVDGLPFDVERLKGLQDGELGLIAEGTACIRIGAGCYHPLKTFRELADVSSDVYLLFSVGESGESVAVSEAFLARVIIHRHNRSIGETTPAATSPLQSLFPENWSKKVDTRLVKGFAAHKARDILACITKVDLKGCVLVATHDARGLCYLGQRFTSDGYETYTVRQRPEENQPLDFAQVAKEFSIESDRCTHVGSHRTKDSGLGTDVSIVARALYGVDDIHTGGEGDTSSGALLATEWDCTNQPSSRALGLPPPPLCKSMLLVCADGCMSPTSDSSFGYSLRRDLAALDFMAESAGEGRTGSENTRPSTSDWCFGSAADSIGWNQRLRDLLSGADVGGGGYGTHTDKSAEEDKTIDGIQLAACMNSSTVTTSRREDRQRNDLDFSERLLQLLVTASTPSDAMDALTSAISAVDKGHILPVINMNNNTVIGRRIQEGVRAAQMQRSGNARIGEHATKGMDSIFSSKQKVSLASLELGLYKVQNDIVHWFQMEQGVTVEDLQWYINSPLSILAEGACTENDLSGAALTQRLMRLQALSSVVDVVLRAQSCGAQWQQIRALAKTALRTHRHGSPSGGHTFDSHAYPLAMPDAIPSHIRAQLGVTLPPLIWQVTTSTVNLTSNDKNNSKVHPGAKNSSSGPTSCGVVSISQSHMMVSAHEFLVPGKKSGCAGFSVENLPRDLVGRVSAAVQSIMKEFSKEEVNGALRSVLGVESVEELQNLSANVHDRESRRRAADVTLSQQIIFTCTKRVVRAPHNGRGAVAA